MDSKTNDRVLKIILDIKQKETHFYCVDNPIINIKKHLPKLSEEDIEASIVDLTQKGYLETKYAGTELLMIMVPANAINYFKDKNELTGKQIKHLIWEGIKFFVPTIISIIALIIAASK
jgi:hypothetical protein